MKKRELKQDNINFDLLMSDSLVKQFLLEPLEKYKEKSIRLLKTENSLEQVFRAQGKIEAIEEVERTIKLGRKR